MEDYNRNSLTVAEVMAALSTLDPSLPVYSEGCDCVGACLGVYKRTGPYRGEWVIISRTSDPECAANG